MRKNALILIGIMLLVAFSGIASSAFASSADGLNPPPKQQKVAQGPAASVIQNVAVFQDQNPWGSTAHTDALTAQAIPYTIYGSAQMGTADLSPFDKVLIPSVQPLSFYTALSANRAWFETFINQGGVFEFHAAPYSAEDWAGLPMPGGITSPGNSTYNFLTIVDPSSPLVVGLDNNSIDNWNSSTHGHFTGAAFPYNTVIEEDATNQPVLIEGPMGSGYVVATMMTVEWGLADPDLIANLVGFPPDLAPASIPTLNEWGLIGLAVLLIGFAVVRMRGRQGLAEG